MNIKTKYLSEVEITENKIIHFPVGLPGFAEETEFVLLDLPENPIFQILQSVKSYEIAFVVTNPYQIYQNYTFELDASLLDSLQISNEKEVAVLSVVTLKNPFKLSTLNLKAPIIINSNLKQGKQYILNTEEYSSTTSIVPAVSEGEVK
ncbi:flagellar assembly protein FliW [Oceanobacillus saliphilus]|uniref:flagellar assembly protein FliW n=1 Tax=Oceanobacillus saliphilus TaxID=2925834 RepID=UPI00201E508B|nr:flagellar assembly protein FliW [Oceanobacillus saliphilus]